MPFDPIRPPALPVSQRPPEPQYMYTERRSEKPDTMARNISIALAALASLGGGGIWYMQPPPAAAAPHPTHHQPHAPATESTAVVLIKHRLDDMGERLDKIEKRSSEHHDLLIRIDAKLPSRRR